jgi:hypothetical protein
MPRLRNPVRRALLGGAGRSVAGPVEQLLGQRRVHLRLLIF